MSRTLQSCKTAVVLPFDPVHGDRALSQFRKVFGDVHLGLYTASALSAAEGSARQGDISTCSLPPFWLTHDGDSQTRFLQLRCDLSVALIVFHVWSLRRKKKHVEPHPRALLHPLESSSQRSSSLSTHGGNDPLRTNIHYQDCERWLIAFSLG